MDEPVMNQESPTQTLPQAEAQQVGEDDPEIWKRFEQFKRNYPIAIFDLIAAKREWELLSTTEQNLAIAGASEYGRECERLKRRPKDAHKFVRDRLFVEFANRSSSGQVTPSFYAADTPQARAVIAIHAIARVIASEMQNGDIVFTKPISRQLLALGEAPPRRDWLWLDDTQKIGAWHALVRETITKARPEFTQMRDGQRGIYAPWPWPPKKDGTLCTGPPDEAAA
jgi:hypothetical protein